MRFLLFSDVHANMPALNSFIDSVEDELDTFDTVYFIGDLVGYCPWPNETVESVKEMSIRAKRFIGVMGNHDYYVVHSTLPLSRFNPAAAEALEYTRTVINEESVRFLQNLPVRHEGGCAALVHGGPADPLFQYLFTVDNSTLSQVNSPFFFYGHTHQPYSAVIGGRLVVNPGSIGQPRDGVPLGSYAVIDVPDDVYHVLVEDWESLRVKEKMSMLKKVKVKNVRFRFDIDAVETEVRKKGLPIGLAERLRSGS